MEEYKQETKLRVPPKPDTKCKFCGYEFKRRVAAPKECARCKKRDFEATI